MPSSYEQSILDEHANSLSRLLSENSGECINCLRPIDAATQERNAGRCDDCSDYTEWMYWMAIEAQYLRECTSAEMLD